ncbi:YozD family protein [Mesobacillus subterraneus]|uniref:YozD family protein n=1 Tax=Mesobacillus subterraneus TaxID=285983 RepID=UPI00203F6896|nr:YozD family protein [Mesobacillus subterraneus]MCM3686098.1 YozD family protein [Mesobacillus subterraneus]
MKEIEVFVDTEEIADFFYKELIKRGLAPKEEDVEEIADIVFEYLLSKKIIDDDEDEL